jgi:undecaprenyl-diphosphatase
MAPEGQRALLLLAAAALLVFGLLAWAVRAGATIAWDHDWLVHAEAAGEAVRRLSAVVTNLGSAWVLAPVVLGVAVWARRRGRRTGARVLVTGALVAETTNLLLKWVMGRERPEVFAEHLPLTHAFPSGHAMVSTVVYAMVAFLVASIEPRWKFPLAVLVPFLCLSIGATRVFLGVHWPSDVVGGFAAGGVLAALGKIATDAAAERDARRQRGT